MTTTDQALAGLRRLAGVEQHDGDYEIRLVTWADNDGPELIIDCIETLCAERDRYRAALDRIDRMDPADFMGGQTHLSPAFRAVDFHEAFAFVCEVVNGVLHNTDRNGKPLPETGDADG